MGLRKLKLDLGFQTSALLASSILFFLFSYACAWPDVLMHELSNPGNVCYPQLNQ